MIKKDELEMLRQGYRTGMRIRLIKMDDIQAPPIGTKGTIIGVDALGTLIVDWDNGSGLNVIIGVDSIEIL